MTLQIYLYRSFLTFDCVCVRLLTSRYLVSSRQIFLVNLIRVAKLFTDQNPFELESFFFLNSKTF